MNCIKIGTIGLMMSRYCEMCACKLDSIDDEDYPFCKKCREKYLWRQEYNYSIHNNPKDEWDNQSVYSEYYTDSYDW